MNGENITNVLDFKLGTLIAAIRDKRLNQHAAFNNNNQPPVKRKPSPRDKHCPAAVFENRLRAQKEMIQNYKTTIDKQEKLIRQLQMQNIALENELVGLKEQLKTKSEKEIKRDLDVITDKIDGLKSPLFNFVRVKTPEVLIRMNKREQERKQRRMLLKEHKELREKQKLEEEVLREEEARRKQLELARFKKQEAILKQQAEEEMKRRHERMKIFSRVFHFKITVISFIERWRMSVQLTKEKLLFCSTVFNRISVETALMAWKIQSDETRERREAEARKRRERLLERRYFSRWKNKYFATKRLERQAERVYELVKIRHFYQSWHLHCLQAQVLREEKYQTVRRVYMMGLFKCYFIRWRQYPRLMYDEREKEKRIRQWHTSIQQMIPDFNV